MHQLNLEKAPHVQDLYQAIFSKLQALLKTQKKFGFAQEDQTKRMRTISNILNLIATHHKLNAPVYEGDTIKGIVKELDAKT